MCSVLEADFGLRMVYYTSTVLINQYSSFLDVKAFAQGHWLLFLAPSLLFTTHYNCKMGQL